MRSDIRESLINLIFNSVDAMPEGGKIILWGKTYESQVCITVEDNGVGMNEETRERCFEPFFTTKGAKGTGLGLAGVYGMIQRHGGSIDIESEPGNGTKIHLFFPIGAIKEKNTAKAELPSQVPPFRILYVEDNKKVRDVVKDILITDGHSVESCNGGEEAIRLFRERTGGKDSFEIVITDWGMPGMDGLELSKRIKEMDNNMPIVLLSGWSSLIQKKNELTDDIDFLLGKPPKISQIRETFYTVYSNRYMRTDSNEK
jgi:CheY-like chemotaxis protein